MKGIIINNYKFILGLIFGLIISVTTVYAIDAYIESSKITYNNHNKKNVQEALDELYEKSGIHKEKWVDPILNGADPVLKDPLIPVEIKNNGETYYANLNSEWYNYNEKRWANAVILIDNPSKKYNVGDKINIDDIESYFVWIPRYQYKIWNMGNYDRLFISTELTNDAENAKGELAFWKVASSNARLIEIKFGTYDKIPKMSESEAALDKYYTHPAFTLGNKDLNGLWVGKFETGYKGATSAISAQVDKIEADHVIIKPDVYSWRGIAVKNIFMTSYNYKRSLDSHMIKNIEWGAVAYLSHSEYGIGSEIRINNNSDFKTGYAAASGTNQDTCPGDYGNTEQYTKPWNTANGYLASSTGNITGAYDLAAGAHEHVAAYREGGTLGDTGFTQGDLSTYSNYFDVYKDSSAWSFNKRILGDATGELGPFYSYTEGNGAGYWHNSWYGDYTDFVDVTYSWTGRGGGILEGSLGGQFDMARGSGGPYYGSGFRIVFAI